MGGIDMITKAFCIACNAHKGQKDKAGAPYILHPLTVALHVKGRARKTVALLHDVVEDTDITIDYLVKSGFSDDVVRAVAAITKSGAETYDEYLYRVRANSIARDVKLADLHHNCNLTRLKEVTDRDKKRVKKYEQAISFLTE